MANAYTYSVNKRHNSTLQPTGGTLVEVTLKGGCDLIAPIFVLSFSGTPTFNYMSFEGRYYFVTGIKSVRNDLWEISCQCDVLATWKSAIQAMDAYVLYYSHTNTEIVDKRLSVKTTQTTDSESASFDYFGKNFIYILSVIGKDCVSQIEVTRSDIKHIVSQNFLDTLENQINAVALPATDSLVDFAQYITDLLASEVGAFSYVGKISDCILNCYVLPITSGAWGGSLTDIYLGKCDTGVDGYALTDSRILHDSATVPIPWQATDWRRNAPYHEIYLYIPAIGITSVSPSDVIDEVAIHVDMSLDKVSGDVIFEVGTASKVIAYYTANVAVNYPVGTSNVDVTKAVTAVGGGLTALASGVNPAITAAVETLGIANVLQPQPTCIGGNSGGALLGLVGYSANKIYCFTVFHDTTVLPSSVSSVKGTPYNGVMSLASVSGYVQTNGASVSGSMTDTEREQINELLNGGVYIE